MRRLLRLFGIARPARDVDEELAFHLEMRTRDLMARGYAEPAAREEAARQFGDVAGIRAGVLQLNQQKERRMRRSLLIEELGQDLRGSLRALVRHPGFSSGVALTLAIGIGGAATIVTLLHALLLRPLPVHEPGELVVIGNPRAVGTVVTGSPREDVFSLPQYEMIAAGTRSLSGVLAAGRTDRLDVAVDGAAPQPLDIRFVSRNYFEVLGVAAARGRTFSAADEPGPPVAVMNDAWWARTFNRDPRAIGATVTVGGRALHLIGVTGPAFSGEVVGQSPALWVPLDAQPILVPWAPRTDAGISWLLLLGRRANGTTLEQARAELTPLVRRSIEEARRASASRDDAPVADIIVPIADGSRGFSRLRADYGAPLLVLLAGVGVLLLMICANVATLLLARGTARAREISVRLAIGANRARLVRQLISESLTLGLLGGAAGLVLAQLGSRALMALAAAGDPVALATGLSLPVTAFTFALAVGSVLLFGLPPALRTSAVPMLGVLRGGSRGTVGRLPLGRVLIAAQVALSLVLVVGAGLLVRTITALQRAPTGLDRDHVLVVFTTVAREGYRDDALQRFALAARDRLAAIPGVTAASWSENGLFAGTESGARAEVPGWEPAHPDDNIISYDQVGPHWAAAVGARVVRGREFTVADGAGAPPVILINESFARYFFGDADPVGRAIRLDGTTVTIVGVIGDVRDQQLTAEPVRRAYISYLQQPLDPAGTARFLVRAAGDPAALAAPVRAALTGLDARLTITPAPLTGLMWRSIRTPQLLARLATAFGVLALLLAMIGLYGVLAFTVARRTGEMGLRLALGARPGSLIGLVLRDALSVVAVGIAIGAPAAVAAVRLLRAQLYGVGPGDPVTLVAAVGILALTAAAAALVPALRAARVAPAVALRQE